MDDSKIKANVRWKKFSDKSSCFGHMTPHEQLVMNPHETKTPSEIMSANEPNAPADPKTPSDPKTPAEPKAPAELKAPADPKTPSEPKTPAEPKAPPASNNSNNLLNEGTTGSQTLSIPLFGFFF